MTKFLNFDELRAMAASKVCGRKLSDHNLNLGVRSVLHLITNKEYQTIVVTEGPCEPKVIPELISILWGIKTGMVKIMFDKNIFLVVREVPKKQFLASSGNQSEIKVISLGPIKPQKKFVELEIPIEAITNLKIANIEESQNAFFRQICFSDEMVFSSTSDKPGNVNHHENKLPTLDEDDNCILLSQATNPAESHLQLSPLGAVNSAASTAVIPNDKSHQHISPLVSGNKSIALLSDILSENESENKTRRPIKVKLYDCCMTSEKIDKMLEALGVIDSSSASEADFQF